MCVCECIHMYIHMFMYVCIYICIYRYVQKFIYTLLVKGTWSPLKISISHPKNVIFNGTS